MCHCLRALLMGALLSGVGSGVVVAQSENDESSATDAKEEATANEQPTANKESAEPPPKVVRKRSSGVDALSIVNQKRARCGLYPFSFDPRLTATAEYKSRNRARRRCTGHDGTSMNGARTEGVGYAAGQGNLPMRFQTCHLYSKSYRSAGAAIAYDNCGRAYYTLLLR